MSEHDKHIPGDGSDNYAAAARKVAEAAKQISQSTAQKAAAAGAEATANAAAATVKAGVESGKAVSEIAVGTASGGPWGAIIAAAWSARHTLFKVLITICLSLLIIVVMVVSLPTIIFNSVFHTDPSVLIASAAADVFQVYEEMSAAVSDCVTGGYEFAQALVESVILSGGYDYDLSMQATIDNAQTSVDYDVCYILAAYSASMEQRGAKNSTFHCILLL